MNDSEWKDVQDADEERRNSTLAAMEAIAKGVDTVLNGKDAVEGRAPRKTAFVLLLYPWGDTSGRTNYITNSATRDEVTKMFEQQIRVFKGEAPDVFDPGQP